MLTAPPACTRRFPSPPAAPPAENELAFLRVQRLRAAAGEQPAAAETAAGRVAQSRSPQGPKQQTQRPNQNQRPDWSLGLHEGGGGRRPFRISHVVQLLSADMTAKRTDEHRLNQDECQSAEDGQSTGVAEIQKDVEYRIPFTVNNSTISVNILLPQQFPQEKPVVSVYPPVGHHLVDSNNGTMISSPLITNFGMHSDLGKVIQSLLDEFWKSPPALMSSSSAGFPYSGLYKPTGIPPYPAQAFHYSPHHVGPGQTPSSGPGPVPAPAPMSHTGVDMVHGPPRAVAPYGLITDLPLPVPTGESQAGLNGHMYKMPEIPETFPELPDMNLNQLSDMSENEDVLLEFFVTLPQFKQVTSDKEELISSIVDTAKKNLQMEPQLEDKRQEMLNKYEQLTQMKTAFEMKMQRQHELSESCSLSTLQARLKVAAHQAEEESEDTAENFLEGGIEIDEFLTSFMEKRTLCHSRRAKEEKLQQCINTHGPFPVSD